MSEKKNSWILLLGILACAILLAPYLGLAFVPSSDDEEHSEVGSESNSRGKPRKTPSQLNSIRDVNSRSAEEDLDELIAPRRSNSGATQIPESGTRIFPLATPTPGSGQLSDIERMLE